MREVLILVINFYQVFLSVIMKNVMGINRMCKFSPTCSEYTKQMVKQHGFFGILLGVKRIGVCK
ncbi:MAG: membrane protein insertion efficiency factor YidD [Candidatus Levybacteria bacterium]|nr:membrane protein insertion efficiency factor YidD [Candidatus Levybacteria bacterium]